MSLVRLLAPCLLVSMAACGDDGGSASPDAAYAPTGTGPAAHMLCTSSGKNAFDTFGATAFVAVNEQIFTNVTDELGAHQGTNLGESFGAIGTGTPAAATDDFPTFKGKVAAFLVYVYGGPDAITYTDNKMYDGKSQNMVTAHTGFNITSAQYDYFLTNIVVPALKAKGVTDADIGSCFGPILMDASVKAMFVGH